MDSDIEINDDIEINIDVDVYTTKPFLFNEMHKILQDEENYKNIFNLVLKDLIIYFLKNKNYKLHYEIIKKDILLNRIKKEYKYNNDMWKTFCETFLK